MQLTVIIRTKSNIFEVTKQNIYLSISGEAKLSQPSSINSFSPCGDFTKLLEDFTYPAGSDKNGFHQIMVMPQFFRKHT